MQPLRTPPLAGGDGTVIRGETDEDERERRKREQQNEAQHERQRGELRESTREQQGEGQPCRGRHRGHRAGEAGIRRDVVFDEPGARRADREPGTEALQHAGAEQPADIRSGGEQHGREGDEQDTEQHRAAAADEVGHAPEDQQYEQEGNRVGAEHRGHDDR